MNYLAVSYLFFFLPLTVLIYHLTKKKYKWKVLLLASYIFFFLLSGKLLVFLLLTTLLIHHFGLWLDRIDQNSSLEEAISEDKKSTKAKFKKAKKQVLALGIFLLVSLLFVYKYLPFFNHNLNTIFKLLNINYQIPYLKIIAPIGISFYTLMALSYLIDVYNHKIESDDNLGRLALYLAFFPTIMEGPIHRYSETAKNLYEPHAITFKNLTFAGQRILWGILKKFIVADRLNALVKIIFDGPHLYNGGLVLLGAISYTIMLYMEFSGTIDVVIGSAEIFDIKLPENFQEPFFSKNISEFWRRWHITLGAWFKDYIFYPVSLSKPLKKLTLKMRQTLGKTYGPLLAGGIALLCVWLLNGLWHGAGWNYIFFGLYHYVLIMLGSLIEPLTKKIPFRHFKIMRIFTFIRVFFLIVIGELIFRATTLTKAFALIKAIFTDFTFASFKSGEVFKLGLDKADFIIIIITLLIVFVVSFLKEKKVNIREKIASQNIVIRWSIYLALIMFIIIFGAYGPGYAPIDPIYANF